MPREVLRTEPIYLDCNATSPIEPRVRDLVICFLDEEFGNAGSRTHAYGTRAKNAIERARRQISSVVDAQPDEVFFTSGATESDNLAILGLVPELEKRGLKHVITSQIEHKAVLEPFDELERRGFSMTRLPVTGGGYVEPDALTAALRPNTGLVSVMHANNETGILQPIVDLAGVLNRHPAYFHVDAAQGFGKDFQTLRNRRVDLISISGHKIYAPKGIGALVARRRGFIRPPLTPLMFGGGQERGLRPGTLPVHLIAGLGLASELAAGEVNVRDAHNRMFRHALLEALAPFSPRLQGDQERCQPHVVNLAFEDLDSEAVMLAWKDLVAVSNGSACTSHAYSPSHVLLAMGVEKTRIDTALRLSWSHLTDLPDLVSMAAAVSRLR